MNVREVGFRSILHDEADTSGTEIVRKMMFLAGSEEEERCAQSTGNQMSVINIAYSRSILIVKKAEVGY